MELSTKFSFRFTRRVSADRADKSERPLLCERSSVSNRVRAESGDRSVMALPATYRALSFRAYSIPVKFTMRWSLAWRLSSLIMSRALIVSPGSICSALSTATRRLGSGISTPRGSRQLILPPFSRLVAPIDGKGTTPRAMFDERLVR